VSRLSIIIPLWADNELFEDTLASVLQNRPSDCEVLVVHSLPYDDPYGLKGEVQFVQTPDNASPSRLVNAGCQASEGEILHVIQPGILACDRWTEAALMSFDDPQVCAVAPLTVAADDADRIVAAGLRYSRGGRRLRHGAGSKLSKSQRVFRRAIVGPALFAGFYRRWLWEAIGGFCERLDADWADMDFSLSLKSLGYRCALEPDSVVRAAAAVVDDAASFGSGHDAERVFWRHAAAQGWLASLVLHPFAVLASVRRDWHRPGAYLQLLGRLTSLLGLPSHLRHAAKVRQAVELFLLETSPATMTRSRGPLGRRSSANRPLPGFRDAA
jgi:GT2 family glycosyltransferase